MKVVIVEKQVSREMVGGIFLPLALAAHHTRSTPPKVRSSRLEDQENLKR